MHRRNLRRAKKGMQMSGGTTLIELLIYIALSAGLLTGVGAITISALDAKTKTEAMKNVFEGATFSMSAMRDIFTRSGSLVSPLPATASSGALFLPGTTNIPELIATSGDRLIVRAQNGTPRYLSSPDIRIERLDFYSVGNSSTSTGIRVRLSVAASSEGLWQAFQYRESFMTTFLFGPR